MNAEQRKVGDVIISIGLVIILDVVKNNCKIKKRGTDQAANKYGCYFLQF
jgi:hypothetical protein